MRSLLNVMIGMCVVTKTEGFAQPQRIPRVATSTTLWSTNNGKRSRKRESTLLDDFKTANGEILNPYRVLKVSRGAPRPEIKNAYRNLSKRYHPDGARFREILPGTCKIDDDVREEWERIKLSYEILSDRKMRLKYDRNSSFADPGAAVGRAALDAMGWGITSVSKGLLKVGASALNGISKSPDQEVELRASTGVGMPPSTNYTDMSFDASY